MSRSAGLEEARPAAATRSTVAPEAAAPDWLYHHLTVSGPADTIAAFAEAARGSGITPWQLDFADIEEDVFLRAVSQPAGRRSLTVEGCRILARQFRESVEARQARAAALVGQSLACPFDLHVLLPVPPTILLLGPAHPLALAWLAANWGTDGPAAPGNGAAEANDRAASADGSCGNRLQLLHLWRNAASGHRQPDVKLDGVAIFAAAASGRLSRIGHGPHRRSGQPAGREAMAGWAAGATRIQTRPRRGAGWRCPTGGRPGRLR